MIAPRQATSAQPAPPSSARLAIQASTVTTNPDPRAASEGGSGGVSFSAARGTTVRDGGGWAVGGPGSGGGEGRAGAGAMGGGGGGGSSGGSCAGGGEGSWAGGGGSGVGSGTGACAAGAQAFPQRAHFTIRADPPGAAGRSTASGTS